MGILKLMHMKEARGKNTSQSLKKAINYIFNPAKTENLIFTGGLHCPNISADAAYQKMLRTKQLLGKADGRQGYHFILSFSPDEDVSPELCLQITEEITKELLDQYECVYAVHTDQKHMHAHIVVNSVSFSTGLKYHYSNGQWKKEMMPVVNRICKAHGLRELELEDAITKDRTAGRNLAHSEVEAQKKGHYTELSHIQSDLDGLILQVSSYEELLQQLQRMGYNIRPGSENYAHLSLIPPESSRTKYMRTDKLGWGYTPEGLKKRIEEHVAQKQEDKEQQTDTVDTAKNVSERMWQGKRMTIRIQRQRISYTKRQVKPLTYFGKCYLKYYLYFNKLRHKPRQVSWADSADVLRTERMLKEIAFIRSHHISKVEDLESISAELQKERKTGNRKLLRRIEQIQNKMPYVLKFINQKKYLQNKMKR